MSLSLFRSLALHSLSCIGPRPVMLLKIKIHIYKYNLYYKVSKNFAYCIIIFLCFIISNFHYFIIYYS